MTENTTLFSEVVLVRPAGVERMRDVPATIQQSPRGHTLVTIRSRDRAVTLRLSNDERISLIEALGGVSVR